MSGPSSHSWRSIKKGEDDANTAAGVVIGVEETIVVGAVGGDVEAVVVAPR
jgi:hypothetical protein